MTDPVEIEDAWELARYVGLKNQIRSPDGEFQGLVFTAFELRSSEEYLSTNCVELAGASQSEGLSSLKKIYANKKLAGKKAVIALGFVSPIKRVFLPDEIYIEHRPKADDPSYTAILELPLQRRKALERLASSEWCKCVPLAEIK